MIIGEEILLSEQFCEEITQNLHCHVVALYYLHDDNHLSQIALSLNEEFEISDAKHIGKFRLNSKESLTGYLIESGERLLYDQNEHGSFPDFLRELKLQAFVDIKAYELIEKQLELQGNGIFNCIMFPFQSERPINIEENTQWLELKFCLTVINCKKKTDSYSSFKDSFNNLSKITDDKKKIIFSAFQQKILLEEREINKKVKLLGEANLSLEETLDKIEIDFSEKLKSKLSHIWYYDPEHELFCLNSIKCYDRNLQYNHDKSHQAFDHVVSQNVRVLKKSDSLIGELCDSELDYIKEDLSIFDGKWNWEGIVKIYGCDNLMALPLISDNLFGVMCFHSNISKDDFERIHPNYFVSFLSQASLLFKYNLSKIFSKQKLNISEKISTQLNKKPDTLINNLLFKLKDILECEACSLFLVNKSGINLISTTDKSQESQDKIGTKVYSTISDGITIYSVQMTKVFNIFCIDKAPNLYKGIKKVSKEFVEKVSNSNYSTMLVVPFYKKKFLDGSWLLLRLINKKNLIKNNPVKVVNFANSDLEIINYIGLELEKVKRNMDSTNARNKLLSLLIHEVESPIKVLRDEARFVQIAIRDLVDEAEYIDGKLAKFRENSETRFDNIYLNAELIRNWSQSVETINTLFRENRITTKKTRINLCELVEDVISFNTRLLNRSNKNMKNIKKVGFDDFVFVNFDKIHLFLIIRNLYENALKYSMAESVNKDVGIKIIEKSDKVDLEFSNYGNGIEEEDVESIFEMGFRGQKSKDQNFKGQGYGLWVVDKLLMANKGVRFIRQLRNPTIMGITLEKIKY